MNLVKTLILLLISFTIFGCDHYTSEIPISDSKHSQIDTNAIGAWATFNKEGKLDWAIKINSLNEHEYILNVISFTEEGERLDIYDNYVAHSSLINNQLYINLRALDCKEKEKYIFYKYELKEDSLITSLLSKEKFKEKFKSSKEFKKYVKKNSQIFDKAFEQDFRFVKINPSPK